MKNLACPANIQFLLHCHVSPTVFPNIDAPHYQSVISQFIEAGLIEHEPGASEDSLRYRTTALGSAYVYALCKVPPPVSVFVDSHGAKINHPYDGDPPHADRTFDSPAHHSYAAEQELERRWRGLRPRQMRHDIDALTSTVMPRLLDCEIRLAGLTRSVEEGPFKSLIDRLASTEARLDAIDDVSKH